MDDDARALDEIRAMVGDRLADAGDHLHAVAAGKRATSIRLARGDVAALRHQLAVLERARAPVPAAPPVVAGAAPVRDRAA